MIKRNKDPPTNSRSWRATILKQVINLLMAPPKHNCASNLYKLLNQNVQQLNKHEKIPKKEYNIPGDPKEIEKISLTSPTNGPTDSWVKANSPKQERSANANMKTNRSRNWNQPISTNCF